jgi:hypothetical protein
MASTAAEWRGREEGERGCGGGQRETARAWLGSRLLIARG